MAKNIANHTQGARLLIKRAEIMAVVRGAKKTGSTKCEINILQSKKDDADDYCSLAEKQEGR